MVVSIIRQQSLAVLKVFFRYPYSLHFQHSPCKLYHLVHHLSISQGCPIIQNVCCKHNTQPLRPTHIIDTYVHQFTILRALGCLICEEHVIDSKEASGLSLHQEMYANISSSLQAMC